MQTEKDPRELKLKIAVLSLLSIILLIIAIPFLEPFLGIEDLGDHMGALGFTLLVGAFFLVDYPQIIMPTAIIGLTMLIVGIIMTR